MSAFKGSAAGSFYFVENGETSFGQIAQAIAQRLGLGEPQSWSIEEATEEWGYIHAAYTFGPNSRVRAKRARAELGCQPRRTSLIQWVERES